jgi:hypothetical protein
MREKIYRVLFYKYTIFSIPARDKHPSTRMSQTIRNQCISFLFWNKNLPKVVRDKMKTAASVLSNVIVDDFGYCNFKFKRKSEIKWWLFTASKIFQTPLPYKLKFSISQRHLAVSEKSLPHAPATPLPLATSTVQSLIGPIAFRDWQRNTCTASFPVTQ